MTKTGSQKFRFLEVTFDADEDGVEIVVSDVHSARITVFDAKTLKEAAMDFRDIAHWLTLQK